MIERPCSVFATHPDRGTWRVYDWAMAEEQASSLAAYLKAHNVVPGVTYEARGYYWRERR